MTPHAFAIFDTAIGRCAVSWRGDELTGVFLPAPDDAAMRTAIIRRAGGPSEAPPPDVAKNAIEKIVRLCRGENISFEDIPLDRARVEPFANRVYDILLETKFGETTTYGAIAGRLGDKSLSRAVGAALGANPFPIIIPCHRVTAAGAKMGGFTAPGGVASKKRLLEIEGAFSAERLPLFGG